MRDAEQKRKDKAAKVQEKNQEHLNKAVSKNTWKYICCNTKGSGVDTQCFMCEHCHNFSCITCGEKWMDDHQINCKSKPKESQRKSTSRKLSGTKRSR